MKRFPLFVCLFLLLLLVFAGIPLAAATPEVYSIYPSSAPINTDITVTITGNGFSSASTPYLYKCALVSGSPGSQRKFAGTIRSVTSTMMVVKFSLSYDPPLKLGSYGVIVNTPMETSPIDMGYKENIFTIYSASDTAYPTTTTTTETETTTNSQSNGENSVFFDTNPSGATVILNGDEVGTSAFTYYTSKDGTYDVVIKKIGFEDYPTKVTIVEGKRVYFYALLTPLSSTTTTATATVSPVKTVTTGRDTTTTAQKSTLKVPTPWGTDPPVTEESPADPAVALGAAGIAIGLVLLRRQ
jgi:hypothetical protein